MGRRAAPLTAERRRSPDKRDSPYCRAEHAVASLAAESHSVLDLDELRECGLDRRAVSRRARNGRLHRIHEGVYAVGHPNISLKGRFMAAVKACRPHGVLSHRAAAAFHGILAWTERAVEVTVPGTVVREHPGIQLHRSSLLTRGDSG